MNPTILILAANPLGTQRLQLGREVDLIKDQIARNGRFKVVDRLSLRYDQIQQILFTARPQVVHFCGHGDIDQLIVENDIGRNHILSIDAIEHLFYLLRDRNIQCVVLNACYSEEIATRISRHIEGYVIGMSQSILDRSALCFSRGFYFALGEGMNYVKAYQFGCNAVELSGKEGNVPRIKYRGRTHVEEDITRIEKKFTTAKSRDGLQESYQLIEELRAHQPNNKRIKQISQSIRNATAFVRTPAGLSNLVSYTWNFWLAVVILWLIMGFNIGDASGIQASLYNMMMGAIAGLITRVLAELAAHQVYRRGTWQQAALRMLFYKIHEIWLWAIGGAIIWGLLCHLFAGLTYLEVPHDSYQGRRYLVLGILCGLASAYLSIWRMSFQGASDLKIKN
jgi:hypothetical protein